MGLFKEVKKPVIRDSKAGGAISTKRPAYVEKKAPCIARCTVDNAVRDWLVPMAQHVAYGRSSDEAFIAAWSAITKRNPFPAVSGRVCQHACENACNRKDKDAPVAVQELERFIGDFAIARGLKLAKPEASAPSARVAVVGAGSGGLSAAYRLVQLGYQVSLVDAAPLPGGMMRYHIPRTILPSATIDYEIRNVLDLGIEFRGNCVVGRDVAADLLERDHEAVIYAVGLQSPAQMQVRRTGQTAFVSGALPAEPPEIPAEATEASRRTLNMVTPAIAQGRQAADEIDAALQGKSVPGPVAAAAITADRMKLTWYPPLDTRATADIRTGSVDFSADEAVAEAARCMSCGMCMDCETCWMYCSNNCFTKLPKGEHYKLRLELCNGCGKCVEACPCGYLEMV
jgi:Pyruvate/2-oxoacid:ferredoxin oxidoreductase delta subunit/enamine deaminase RidA (YjgF/YER057c/UK114 family)